MHIIRKLECEDMDKASRVMFKIFYKFISHGYTMEGIEKFRDLIDPISLKINTVDGSVTIYGYFDDGEPIGYIGMRGTNHICLFFVKEEYQGCGIGRKLFEHALSLCDKTKPITVNSSDYAIPIYTALGFEICGERVTRDGIIANPMIRKNTKTP